MQDHAWSALLREPEADEDSSESDRSYVKTPGPNVFSRVTQLWLGPLHVPAQRGSRYVHADRGA